MHYYDIFSGIKTLLLIISEKQAQNTRGTPTPIHPHTHKEKKKSNLHRSEKLR